MRTVQVRNVPTKGTLLFRHRVYSFVVQHETEHKKTDGSASNLNFKMWAHDFQREARLGAIRKFQIKADPQDQEGPHPEARHPNDPIGTSRLPMLG